MRVPNIDRNAMKVNMKLWYDRNMNENKVKEGVIKNAYKFVNIYV